MLFKRLPWRAGGANEHMFVWACGVMKKAFAACHHGLQWPHGTGGRRCFDRTNARGTNARPLAHVSHWQVCYGLDPGVFDDLRYLGVLALSTLGISSTVCCQRFWVLCLTLSWQMLPLDFLRPCMCFQLLDLSGQAKRQFALCGRPATRESACRATLAAQDEPTPG